MNYALESRIEELLGPSRSHGINRSYRCPFHEERNASFSINVDEGLWVCFGCGAKGNYESLCTRLGEVPDAEYRWLKAQKDACSEFHQPPDFRDQLGDGTGLLVDAFCKERGIRQGSIEAYGVVEQGNRIAFPYYDTSGRVTGIKYRDIHGNKYAEPGSEFGLYGVLNGVGAPQVVICEGESDTLRLHTASNGRFAVVGTSGASVSEAQWNLFGINLLFAQRIFIAHDADEAGDRCAEIGMRVLGHERTVRLRPTRGKDISEHLQRGGSIREMVG